MSLVGKQRGDTRWPLSRSIAAAVAAVAIGLPSAPSPGASLQPAPQNVTRTALPPRSGAVAKKKATAKRRGGSPPRPLYRNAKRVRRKMLVALFGIPETGRQWVRLHKRLRREGPVLLTMPLDVLARIRLLRFA